MIARGLELPPRARPRVPDGIRVYAIGDVHGRADLLANMFAAIDDNLAAYPAQRPIQILLGDYIDRGPQSREVIELLLKRSRRQTLVCLKGNHESYALQCLAAPGLLRDWMHMGGLNTLLSYGIAPPGNDPSTLETVASAFKKALPETHRKFLEGLPLSFECGDYFFVHAGVRPGVPLKQQHEQDLLWIRDDFLLHEEAFERVIVHGHTPDTAPQILPNRIDIDTGAYATGRLTCLILQGSQRAVIST